MKRQSLRVLLVEDDPTHSLLMGERLTTLGADVVSADNRARAVQALRRGSFDLVILDLGLPDGDGFDVQDCIRALDNSPPVVFVTSDDLAENAVRAMRGGAADYVVKRPRYLDQLASAVQALSRSPVESSRAIERGRKTRNLVGSSNEMRRVRRLVAEYGPTDAPVLITGETGTGKELVAKGLHAASDRVNKPFVAVNCAAVASSLFESEIFGSARGAFTGSTQDRGGLVGEAAGGTLLLDEVSELLPTEQAKLLRFMEEGTYRRVGEGRERTIDVRILAAANRDLGPMVQAGAFRIDLYYRLKVLHVEVAPLRSRRHDIPAIVESILQGLTIGREPPEVTSEALAELMAHEWPGNVRELVHTVERTLIETVESPIRRFSIEPLNPQDRPDGRSTRLDHSTITSSLLRHRGRVQAVADEFGVSTRTIQRRMREMNLRPKDFRIAPL